MGLISSFWIQIVSWIQLNCIATLWEVGILCLKKRRTLTQFIAARKDIFRLTWTKIVKEIIDIDVLFYCYFDNLR